MKCLKCGSENIAVVVDVSLVIPPEYVHNLSKQAIRDKEVSISFAKWYTACVVCKDCNHVHSGCEY